MLRPVIENETSNDDGAAAPTRSEGPQSTPVRERAKRWAPAAVLAAAMVGAFAYVLPRGSRNPLIETTLWSLLVTTSFAGWGSLVAFVVARKERVDLGLRVAWGAAAVCFLGGLLMTLALMGRMTAFVLVEVGLALALGAIARERDAVRSSLRLVARLVVREPRVMTVAAVVAGLVAFQYLAGISDWHTNPYDDDIAYLAFVRKLLDTGSIIEPFSLRRLSALGGQTLFLELVAVRAVPSQGHTFDRSIAVLMVVLLVLGHRGRGSGRGRRLPLLLTLAAVLLFITLPSIAINTASYYSGVAFFFALYRTLSWAEHARGRRGPIAAAAPLALVAATICTLRQNYIAVPPLVLAASYGFELLAWRRLGVAGGAPSWRERLAEPVACAALSLVALAPWFVVGWQSNRTFLYPVMLGTANPAMLLSSSASTPLRELHLLLQTLLEGVPVHLIGLFVLSAALLRERSARKPVWSMGIGSAGGLVLLVHGLSQGDAGNLGRYAFGFVMAFVLAVIVAAGATRLTGAATPPLLRARLAVGITSFAILAPLVEAREKVDKDWARSFENVEAAWNHAPRSTGTHPSETGLYINLQNAVPAGAKMAVMLDEPHWLDFGRNPIFNLDMPGYSSLPPGLPYFEGPDRVEEYFKGLGVRYVAFVRPGFSRYHYRRDYWIQMLVDEQELWRTHAPYLIDFYDNLVALDARHGRIFDDRGMSVVDLERVP